MDHVFKACLLITTTLLFANTSFAVGAGGYANQVPSARAMGRANSVTASIDDATAVTFNPARLTAVNGSNVNIGFTLQKIHTDYDNGAGTTDSADHHTGLSPNFHISSHFGSEKWGFGLGVTAPHGVATKWGDTSPLRYIATETDLAIMDINPAVAYQITDKISIGGGIDYYYIPNVEASKKINVTNLNFAIDGSVGANADATQKLSGDGDDFGFNLGISGSLSEKHLYGITFRKGAAIDVEGDVEISNLSGISSTLFGGADYKTTIESTVYVPDQLMLGYAFKPSEKWIFELDGEWNKWSAFQDQNIKFTSETDPDRLGILSSDNPTSKNWEDTWSLGLGTEFQATDILVLRGGYGFFDAAVPGSSFEASTPDSDIHLFALGVGFIVRNMTVDLSSQFYFLNDRSITNNVGASDGTTGNGTYETTAQYYGLNFGYNF